jgi:hypothetical protein
LSRLVMLFSIIPLSWIYRITRGYLHNWAHDKALQTDQGHLSCLLQAQKVRRIAFAAELQRSLDPVRNGTLVTIAFGADR